MLNYDNENDFTEALRLALSIGIQDVRKGTKKRTGAELMDRLDAEYRGYQKTALHTVYTAGRTNEENAQKARTSGK